MEENVNNKSEGSKDSNAKKNEHKIGEYSSVDDFTKQALPSIVEATKSVNQFPSGASRDLYCAYPTFSKIVDTTSDRILELISSVLKYENIRGNIQRRQQDEQFELLTECNDVMLEKINSNLDELAGIKKNPQINSTITSVRTNIIESTRSIGSWNLSNNSKSSSESTIALLNAKNIARPQLNFKISIDNDPDSPFEPKIKEKPNALKPLAILPEYDEDGNIESFLHPYEFEILKFEPSASQLESKQPKLPKKIENSASELIEKEEQLKRLIYDLRNVNEIAVDLEHHSYRSFQGISCLIQLSTKSKDYIIDGLKLRDELHTLNEIFTNPNILKIFHGADLDILWLQRDFGLYVVNMFDTHQAAKLLGLPRLSLAFLLKHFCDIEADKTYQLADWRIRPLPEELIYYARQDTHYLIYIYELLCNELINKGNDQINLLKTVYQRSADICKRRYVKPKISPESHMDIYRKSKRIFDNRQLYALKEIFQWRDKISRKEDESYGYVLPNHMMLQTAESLPREMQGILACCNPIPPLVRQNLHALHQIILKARDQPLIKPIINEQIENRIFNHIDINDRLYCPHDLSHNPEFRDDLPTLLNSDEENLNNLGHLELIKPVVSVFDNLIFLQEDSVKKKLDEIKKVKFITPYERYKAIIPFAEKQNMEEIEKLEAIRKSMQLCPDKSELDNSQNDTKEKNNDHDRYKLPVKKDLKRKRESDTPSNNKTVMENTTVTNKVTNLNQFSNNQNKRKLVEHSGHKTETTVVDNEEHTSSKKMKKEKSEVIVVSDSDEETNLGQITTVKSDKVKEEKLETTDSSELETNSLNSRKIKKKKRKLMPKMKTSQSSNQAVEFDYSKVDFSKFQGGAKNIKAVNNPVQSKFFGKSKPVAANINKKFNKLFAFSKTNKK